MRELAAKTPEWARLFASRERFKGLLPLIGTNARPVIPLLINAALGQPSRMDNTTQLRGVAASVAVWAGTDSLPIEVVHFPARKSRPSQKPFRILKGADAVWGHTGLQRDLSGDLVTWRQARRRKAQRPRED
jgi:hypothetical protein